MSQSQKRTTLSLSKNSASDANRNRADSKATGQNKAKRASGKPNNKGGKGKAPFKKDTSNKNAPKRSGLKSLLARSAPVVHNAIRIP